MPSNVRVYSALLSSPRGIESDRDAVHKAVAEANRFLRADAIAIEVRDWERDVRPTVGTDGQDVVNRQLCNDCDLAFILIHDRVGSPTPRARSGTIEEAEIVLSRRENGERVDLLAFFRKPTVNLSQETLSNLNDVLLFRKSLEDRGVFWREYTDSSELEALVRIHLPSAVRALEGNEHRAGSEDVRDLGLAGMSALVVPSPAPPSMDNEELGSLDFELGFAESLEEITEAMNAITAANEALTAKMQSKAGELRILGSAENREPRRIKDNIDAISSELTSYNDVLKAQLPAFEHAVPLMSSSLIGMVSMSTQEFRGDDDDLRSLRATISTVSKRIIETSRQFQAQKEAMAAVPRMTKELNAAKREGTQLIDQLTDAWHRLSVELDEVGKAIQRRLDP